MSAIGGIADFFKNEVDFGKINQMRMSMSLRGRAYSEAFMYNGISMFFNESRDVKKIDKTELQPYITKRRGHIYAICIDGEDFNSSAIIENYLIHGSDFLGLLKGGFALAIYDSEKEMLILARDRKGKKPLYYRIFENKIFFSSEIKGIVSGTEDRIVLNREILQGHITSPIGIYRAVNIYANIEEVRAGECVIFTSIGKSKFFYRERRDLRMLNGTRMVEKKEKIMCPHPSFDMDNLFDYLLNALVVFDYPQFDCYMPSLMELFGRLLDCKAQTLTFEDGIRRKNISYAIEREDRIGGLYGIDAHGVIPQGVVRPQSDCLYKTEECLLEYLFSYDNIKKEILKSVFGEYKLYALLKMFEQRNTKTEDTEKRIRILGMIIQTVEWIEMHNPIMLEEVNCCYSQII